MALPFVLLELFFGSFPELKKSFADVRTFTGSIDSLFVKSYTNPMTYFNIYRAC